LIGGSSLLLLIRYLFRSPHIVRKIGIGIMVFYWKRHIFQLSSYAGIFYGLKTNINNLLKIDDKYQSKKLLKHYVPKIKGNQTTFTKSDYYSFAFPKKGKIFKK
jgi:hypothetical protein